MLLLGLFSSCSEQGLLSTEVLGLLMQRILFLQSMDSRFSGFSSCGSCALENRPSSYGA